MLSFCFSFPLHKNIFTAFKIPKRRRENFVFFHLSFAIFTVGNTQIFLFWALLYMLFVPYKMCSHLKPNNKLPDLALLVVCFVNRNLN